MSELKIGDTLLIQFQWQRSPLLYTIVGETRQSLACQSAHHGRVVKVRKSDMTFDQGSGYGRARAMTPSGHEEQVWRDKAIRAIKAALDTPQPTDRLTAIVQTLGLSV